MAIDTSLIKVGDKITAEIIVGEAWGNLGFRSPRISGYKSGRVSYFHLKDIVKHTPAPAATVVGAKFQITINGPVYRIVAIEDGMVIYTWGIGPYRRCGMASFAKVTEYMQNNPVLQDNN